MSVAQWIAEFPAWARVLLGWLIPLAVLGYVFLPDRVRNIFMGDR